MRRCLCVMEHRKKESKAFDDWDYKWVAELALILRAKRKAYCVLYVCSYHSVSTVPFIRFHLFSEAVFRSWRIRWSISCVFSIFSHFHLAFFVLFLLTFTICFALLQCSSLYVFIHISLPLSLLFVFLLYLLLSLVHLCVCDCEFMLSSTALSQKVASILFATSWLPSKYSLRTYIRI